MITPNKESLSIDDSNEKTTGDWLVYTTCDWLIWLLDVRQALKYIYLTLSVKPN